MANYRVVNSRGQKQHNVTDDLDVARKQQRLLTQRANPKNTFHCPPYRVQVEVSGPVWQDVPDETPPIRGQQYRIVNPRGQDQYPNKEFASLEEAQRLAAADNKWAATKASRDPKVKPYGPYTVQEKQWVDAPTPLPIPEDLPTEVTAVDYTNPQGEREVTASHQRSWGSALNARRFRGKVIEWEEIL